jgi:hypothetical protein
MLINKSFTAGEVVTIKLTNGDEILARYEEETADTVTINRPLLVTISGQGLGMIPWVFLSSKETYTLQKSQLFFVVPTKKDAADQYTQSTTGIALA